MAHWRDVLPADRFLEVPYEALFVLDREVAYRLASGFRNEGNADLATTLMYIFADFANAGDQDFYEAQIPASISYEKYTMLNEYGNYLKKSSPSVVKKGLGTMQAFALHGEIWYERYVATQGIYNTLLEYRLILAPEDSKAKDYDRSGKILTPSERSDYEATVEELEKALKTIKSKEQNPSLVKRYKLFE